jgi:hypothetical protein
MGNPPAIKEIQEDAKGGDQDVETGDDSGDSDLFGGAGPTLGLTKKQLALVALVVAVAVAVMLYRRSDGGDDGGDDQDDGVAEAEVQKMQAALGDSSDNLEAEDDDPAARVPASPDDDLAGDEAVVEYMKEAGYVSGDE